MLKLWPRIRNLDSGGGGNAGLNGGGGDAAGTSNSDDAVGGGMRLDVFYGFTDHVIKQLEKVTRRDKLNTQQQPH